MVANVVSMPLSNFVFILEMTISKVNQLLRNGNGTNSTFKGQSFTSRIKFIHLTLSPIVTIIIGIVVDIRFNKGKNLQYYKWIFGCTITNICTSKLDVQYLVSNVRQCDDKNPIVLMMGKLLCCISSFDYCVVTVMVLSINRVYHVNLRVVRPLVSKFKVVVDQCDKGICIHIMVVWHPETLLQQEHKAIIGGLLSPETNTTNINNEVHDLELEDYGIMCASESSDADIVNRMNVKSYYVLFDKIQAICRRAWDALGRQITNNKHNINNYHQQSLAIVNNLILISRLPKLFSIFKLGIFGSNKRNKSTDSNDETKYLVPTKKIWSSNQEINATNPNFSIITVTLK
ncbi:hypothetical protein ACTA71_003275 [Dictyostelium dimigraforme]